jgi:putative transposase
MSRHQAAAHYGVAISTAINWVKRFRQTASVAPGQMGGHKPRAISGAHRDWLIARCRDRAFTLRGLVAELAVERGLAVDYRSVWAFVHAEGLSYKKKRSGQRAGPARHRASAGAVAALPISDRPSAPGVHR